MSLKIEKVTPSFRDLNKIESLNQEAFPPEERMPLQEMLELIQMKKIEVSALYDEWQFVGFYVLTVEEKVGYILFLAIASDKRSQGYGSRALRCMKKQYPEHQIILDMEPVEESAPNLQQRISRKQFYLRNGFYETGYVMEYKGLKMEVLCSQKTFLEKEFASLLDHLNIRGIPFYLREI